jgi:hypothetical protein
MPSRSPSAHYEVRTTFRAPLGFVYRWCTNYTSDDSGYTGEGYVRRVLSRSAQTVVLEDLYDTGPGWIWLRRVVRLSPPHGWRADSLGSDRKISVRYRLSELSGNRTQLTIRARRRPYGIGTKNPTKSAWEGLVAANWKKFGRALEREYERSGVRPARRDRDHRPRPKRSRLAGPTPRTSD